MEDVAAVRRQEVVVMFTDIVDFTAYCDTHGEEAGLALVSRHENLVFPIVRSHEGSVVKTIGDAVMSYFSDAKKAALAGQAIMKAVEADNSGKPSLDQMHLRAAFNLGSVMIRNSDLFGDAVNVASRMMSVGLADQIVISRSVIDRLGDDPRFICRFVGNADFHGKTGVVEVYELLGKPLELKEKTKSRIVSETLGMPESAETRREETLIGGKYFIEKLIGEGAYGKVFKARVAKDGTPVAIKILPQDAFVYYSHEAEVLRQLQPFPYVMEIIEAIVDPQGLCIVMPYIQHGSLQTYMNKLHGEALEPGKVLSLMQELLAAIGHAHSKQVIHRDIKPPNILLRKGVDGVLTDFGIAHAVESTGRGSTMTAGTSGYIAPEVTSGRFDSTIDLYAAGVVLYKMLGGEFPLDVRTLPEVAPPEFKRIVERATAVRSKRYAQAADMQEEIWKLGNKLIGATIQVIAQAGEERILICVNDATWNRLEPVIASMRVDVMRSTLPDLIKSVYWHVPSVTIVDYVTLTSSPAEPKEVIGACASLGTKLIITGCSSESEARPLLKSGADDCLRSLEIEGADDALKSSVDALITQVQMSSPWWKRVLG